MRLSIISLALVAAFAPSISAVAEDFPSKAVYIISPHQTGSTTELFGRMISNEMGELLGKPIVIEARAGAAGTTATREVASAKPDGYMAIMNASIHVMYPGMFRELGFDPQKSFVPVGIFGTAPMVVVVARSSKITSFQDMITKARANPKSLTFASGGRGSLPHLVAELVNLHNSIEITHVAYNGTGKAVSDVLGGHVDILYASVASAEPLIRSGDMRALAVTSAKRVALLPEVPTIAEQGMADFDVTSWYGLWVPKETPASVVQRLNRAMRDASALPAVQQRMAKQGIIASTLTADEFAAFAAAEGKKWLDVMQRVGIQPN